jgi:DNA polymerase I-like protein with 3'-5' exonuclease and polymerase domains
MDFGSPASAEAHKLMLRGADALATVEANGIRIDVEKLQSQKFSVQNRIKELDKELRDGEVWSLMRRQFGQKANMSSRDQIGAVVFGKLGFASTKKTATGKPKIDEEVLSSIDLPWLRTWLDRMKLDKVQGTYLTGILREVVYHKDWATGDMLHLLHPVFNLHTTMTYRSSSDSPNFQNMPVRHPKYAKLIREIFIPRPGHRLVEIDFSGAEVRVAACYHQDPTMLRYLAEDHDMHKDMAAECFMLPVSEVPKLCRQTAKGGFTFAAFYGDFWLSIANNLWEKMAADKLLTKGGVPIREHLLSQGIIGLGDVTSQMLRDLKGTRKKLDLQTGTFQTHIHEIERNFWRERFPVYNKWRNDFYAKYKELGYFCTLTGFRIDVPLKRNEVINNPVQGSSFHCLLWSMCKIQNLCKKRGLRAYIVGQIHDSIVSDVHDDDYVEYLAIAKSVIEIQLRQHYPWLITGMVAEAKASAVAEAGGNWFSTEDETAF